MKILVLGGSPDRGDSTRMHIESFAQPACELGKTLR